MSCLTNYSCLGALWWTWCCVNKNWVTICWGGVRLGEAGSLSIAVGVQSARVWVMCGRAGSRACTTEVLSPPRGSAILFEDRVFTPLDTTIVVELSCQMSL